jgi:hypothetical protein
MLMIAVRVHFVFGFGIGLIASATLFARPAVAEEWYMYISLSRPVRIEDRNPGFGVALASQDYGLTTVGARAERRSLPLLRGDGLGDRINHRKQVEVADFSIWMRGWCGL